MPLRINIVPAASAPASMVNDSGLLQTPAVALADKQIHQHQRNNQAQQTATSSLCWAGAALRLSGVPRSKNSASRATAIEKTKIQRQPRPVAIAPPTKEQRPLPPHEPMTQKLTARCRARPLIPGLNQRQRAGIMQAADSPCSTRPARNSPGP